MNSEIRNRLIEKTDGEGNLWLVPDIDYEDDGSIKKYRNPMTHLTPKKKKRKK